MALVTALGVGLAMSLRPALSYSIRFTLGLEKPVQATSGSFYAVRVEPLLKEHCIGCHGDNRQKGDLRLDSLAATLRGGKHGAVVLAGNVKGSELMRRLTLPPENDKAMPPSGKDPMSADEIAVIKLWVATGASGTLPVAAIKGAPPPAKKVEFPELDQRAVMRARAPLVPVVQKLQKRFPGLLTYESRGSADLQVNASLLGRAFGDEELAMLAPLSKHIVWADFSGTAITDASAQTLAGYRRVRTLRLANTGLTEATARALASIDTLESLTVFETDFSEVSLGALRDRGVKIYHGSKASHGPNAAS